MWAVVGIAVHFRDVGHTQPEFESYEEPELTSFTREIWELRETCGASNPNPENSDSYVP